MSDVKFTLLGPDTITLAKHTVDKLLRVGDGDAALLYLYILKTHGQGTSAEAAVALGKDTGTIATAMAVLSRLGLIECNAATAPPQAGISVPEESVLQSHEPHRYSSDEITREIQTNPDFSALLDETQRSLGKILSPDDISMLLGIYEELRLPSDVILTLITHCINESRARGGIRMPPMRYIEKAAYTWEREGILTLDRAEEYLKALELSKSARGEIKRALQISNRELSASERRYVDSWMAMGFKADAVEIAYDRTVISTGRLTWNYMDKILSRWHSKGLHSPQEIFENDKLFENKPQQSNAKPSEQKFGPPSADEYARMQRVLKKLKDEK